MSDRIEHLNQAERKRKRSQDRKHSAAYRERKAEAAEAQASWEQKKKELLARLTPICGAEEAEERVAAHRWINVMADLGMTLYNFFRGWDEPTMTPKHLEMLDEIVSDLAKVPELYVEDPDPILKENLWDRSVRFYGNLGCYFPEPADAKLYFETELRRYRGENIPRYVPPPKSA